MTLKNVFKTTIVALTTIFCFHTAKADDNIVIARADIPTAIVLRVCKALPDDQQGEIIDYGHAKYPADGVWDLDMATCRDERVEMYNPNDLEGNQPIPDFSNPMVCVRMGMMETPHYQEMHPGWFVIKVKCPNKDGSFPR